MEAFGKIIVQNISCQGDFGGFIYAHSKNEISISSINSQILFSDLAASAGIIAYLDN
jgi:hypothetical protein